MSKRLNLIEQILLGLVLVGTLGGFWYFEESFFLRILAVIFSLLGIFLIFSKKDSTDQFSSRRELLVLLILYLGMLVLYNLLYIVGLPLALIMIIVLILTTILFYSLFSLDGFDKLLTKPIFHGLVVLLGIVLLEVFLSLYFWPISSETKSLILVVIFYLIMSLIYLYIHSMLRLKRIAGYLIVSILILGIIFVITWLGFAR